MTLHTIALEAFANFDTDFRTYDFSNAQMFIADSHHKLIDLGEHSNLLQALGNIAAHAQDFDECFPDHHLHQATVIGVVVCLWFVPTGSSLHVEPSKHPMRQRIRTVLAVNTKLEMACITEFVDTPDKITVEEPSEPGGTLPNALKATMEAILAYQKRLALRK